MEISRFFYGGFNALNSPVHYHTPSALKMMQRLSVGKIKEGLSAAIFKPRSPSASIDPKDDTWKLINKKMLTAVHAVFQFKSENHKITAMLPYFDHCGKYYTLYSKHLNMSRNLACIFTPSDSMVPHYLNLLGAFTKGEAFSTPFPDINGVTKENLELYLKKMNEFSTFMHEFPIGQEGTKGIKNEFKVRGPYVISSFIIYIRDLD